MSTSLILARLKQMVRGSTRRSGVALVMVLSSMTLIALLVLVFLSMARIEQQSSSAYADSVNVRSLSEVPINLAIAQIRKGTEQLGGQKNWTSQPGLIRIFGTEDDGGHLRSKAVALHKLYSDDVMVVTKPGATASTGGLTPAEVRAALETDVTEMQDWDQKKGLYVDLNEPVPVTGPGSTTAEWEFPIADPRGMMPDDATGLAVDGFKVTGAVSGTKVPGSRTDSSGRLPMPVKWLYILKDGRVTAPLTLQDGKVRFGDPVPTKENPIVGRVAFWTDDESSKVNINTALEGVPWETPRTTSKRDKDYAQRMPARNEFSRYPGHPAQTCLSPVFQAFGPSFVIKPDLTDGVLATRLENLHKISPRYRWGGTKGGTQKATAAILNDKTDRLYATLDELLYDKERQQNAPDELDGRDLAIAKFVLTTNSRAPELTPFNKPKVMLWPLSYSSAERNAFDRLMAMLGSSGTEGGNSRNDGFYFERYANADIPSGKVGSGHTTWEDLKTDSNLRNSSMLSSYLVCAFGHPSNNMVHFFPGFVGYSDPADKKSFSSKSKFGTGKRDQILTEMLDLLRWGVNTENTMEEKDQNGVVYKYLPPHNDPKNNPTRRAESSAAPLSTFKEFPDATNNKYAGFHTSVNNDVVKNTKGFGRFPTFTEATLVFFRTDTPATPTTPSKPAMQVYLIVEPFAPSCGPPAWTANYRYRVLFENQAGGRFAVKMGSATTAKPLNFPKPRDYSAATAADPKYQSTAPFRDIRSHWPVSMVNFPSDLLEGGNTTPFAGLLSQFKRGYHRGPPDPIAKPSKTVRQDPGNFNFGGDGTLNDQHGNNFPFYSELIEIPAGATEFDFTGGSMTIATFLGWTGDDKHLPVQRIRMHFPAVRLTIPNGPPTTLQQRLSLPTTATELRDGLIRAGDVTRSVEVNPVGPAKGDLRFYSALHDIPTIVNGDAIDTANSYFIPSPNYFNILAMQDHGLRDGAWMTEPQFGSVSTANTAGSLLKGVVYPAAATPAVTRGLNGAYRSDGRPGDWDNGIGGIEDGPYVNKPDEGNGGLPEGGYFSRGGEYASEDGTTFSPNRMISSAVIFGSLPSGIHGFISYPNYPGYQSSPWGHPAPWQTLLFCPNPAGRTTPASQEPDTSDHPGFTTPRDHLLLDLFWMPVIEPYAISDGFSTAGKINMNYQMMPFTHIERSTGMHAALKSTQVTAIPVSQVGDYKKPSGSSLEFRYNVNTEATLKGIKKRFDVWDVYRTPSEICNVFLVPQRIPGASYGAAAAPPTEYDDMNEWWNGSPNTADAMDLTGDNVREAPYGQLYPRLCTQSNTFTVHYRVQTLRKARSTAVDVWEEGKDAVSAEYRGSCMLERYLDPNEEELGTIGVGSGKFINTWDGFFRFRVVQNKQFAR
ncbi:uncharacterized protein (TIGR02600 family) [Roseimicrobium gellanilyticum]|uniref:Uncharacterized protein (TIGR02600 family) n=1 Tax=Roseimicrobium gellanilyticum TaxID=748857 RepID=A0A366HC74_9BACT|nr:Verru_Chthon cassette protein A [Roseimicrobium gellanilyticum]RBP39133.1 uncharacterized protein (TIGR02600 family) [Roseimicrobium gellanilyticum]